MASQNDPPQKKPHPFEQLTQHSDGRLAERYEEEYEGERLRYLLSVFKTALGGISIASMEKRLRSVDADKYGGRGSLTFKAFNGEFPTFPLLLSSSTLGGCKLHLDPHCLLPSLFKQFDATPFVTAYEEFYERESGRANGRVLGLVFRRKGIRHGLIIHGKGIEGVLYRGLSLVYTGGKKAQHALYVRPYQSLLEAIHGSGGSGWRPDEA